MRPVLASVLLLVTCSIANAQNFEKHGFHHANHTNNGKTARTTIADPAEDNYDVKYVKLDVAMNNMTTSISGNVTTKAVVTGASLPAYVFELDTAFTIDSVLINGVSRPFTTTAPDIRRCSLATALATGVLFTARVYYHGATPVPATPYEQVGIVTSFDTTYKVNSSYTHSESYTASQWWPCKQSLRDKIDSTDIWITVPDSLKAGSNGTLVNVTVVDATHDRYEWKERYPIDYYLLSIAVAPFVDYSYYMHFTGSPDSMKIQNYVLPGMLADPYYKTQLDSVGMIVDYYSTIFGRYPFWQEKYGHSVVAGYEGMEHQTMTTVGVYSLGIYTVAHELAHQWWGDNVTCGTWRDITMNEGMATYSEILFDEHFHTVADAQDYMDNIQFNTKLYDTGTVYTTDTSQERVFDGRLTYYKGACVVHMLRSVINNDNSFLNLLQTYQQQRQYGSGTIDDFKNTATTLLGPVVNNINIDTFFKKWFYLNGYPKYTVKWDQVGIDVYLKIDQAGAVPSSVSYFELPLEVKLTALSGDTVVRVLVDQPTQSFHFTWNRAMVTGSLDPDHWLVYRTAGFSRDHTLNVSEASAPAVMISPNPATTGWAVSNVPANSTLALTDLYGRTLWEINNANASLNISADQLAAGMYVLKVLPKDGVSATYKLIKQ